jgi:hypothetical protein
MNHLSNEELQEIRQMFASGTVFPVDVEGTNRLVRLGVRLLAHIDHQRNTYLQGYAAWKEAFEYAHDKAVKAEEALERLRATIPKE